MAQNEKLLTTNAPLGMVSMMDPARIPTGASPLTSGFEFGELTWKRRPGTVRVAAGISGPILLVDYVRPYQRTNPLYTRKSTIWQKYLYTIDFDKNPISAGETVTFTISESIDQSNAGTLGASGGAFPALYDKNSIWETVFWLEARDTGATATAAWTKVLGPVRAITDLPHYWNPSTGGTYEFRMWMEPCYSFQTPADVYDLSSDFYSRYENWGDTTYFYDTEKATRKDVTWLKWMNTSSSTIALRTASELVVSPGTAISDNFDRADGALGAAWNVSGQTATMTQAEIRTNVLTKTWDTDLYSWGVYKTALSTVDHCLEASMKLASATYNVRNFVRIAVRAPNTSSPNSGYMVNAAVASVGTAGYPRGIQIVRGATILAEDYTIGISNDRFYDVKAQVKNVSGNPEITVWLDGVQVLTYTDTSASKVTTGNYCSFTMYRGYLDNFAGWDV